jgi:hypothetical protein
VALAAASNLLPASVKAHWPWLFIFEALAVFAFGISWFVKGQTLLPALKDPLSAQSPTPALARSGNH